MNRPKVVIINSASADGRLAVSPDVLLLHGDERWQAIEEWSESTESGSPFEWLRFTHKPEATLEGSGSFVRESDKAEPLPPFEDDPKTLYRDFVPEAVARRPGHQGWFTVVDGRGRGRGWIKDGAAFGETWQGWHLLVLVGHHTPAEYLAYLRREEIPYLVADGEEKHVDLKLALEKMWSLLSVTCILSTAGGRMNGALLRASLVDEINIEFLPAIIGGSNTPSLFDSPALKLNEQPTRLKLICCQVQAGGRVWLRYEVVRE